MYVHKWSSTSQVHQIRNHQNKKCAFFHHLDIFCIIIYSTSLIFSPPPHHNVNRVSGCNFLWILCIFLFLEVVCGVSDHVQQHRWQEGGQNIAKQNKNFLVWHSDYVPQKEHKTFSGYVFLFGYSDNIIKRLLKI